MPSTVLPNIWISRRYESNAKRSLPACAANPRTDCVVQTDVQDGLHHSRHRELRPGPHRHEQRVVRLAEALPHPRFHVRQMLAHLIGQLRRLSTRLQIRLAGLDRDREPRRDRQAEVRHLGQVGALATQQIL